MELGTVRTLTEDEKRKIARTRLSGSPPGRTGGGGDGPDRGDGDWGDRPTEEPAPSGTVDKSKYIAWFLLMAVGMTFAGLLGAYLMIATNRAAEWQPFALPIQIWISTVIILLSSVTYSLGKRSVDKDEFLAARKWFIATTVLGAFFVSSQFILWIELVQRGFYLSGNPYAGFFYILTAAHMVHVAGGIVALAAIFLRAWYPAQSDTERARRRDLARSVGWYWHFMGFLWVILFLMLGFWK